MRKIDMEKAKEILRLHQVMGLSQREIAESIGCSLGTVSNVLQKAREAGIEFPNQLSSKELGSLLYPPTKATDGAKTPEPDLAYIHKEMQRKGVTLYLLWEEYKTEHPDGLMYTQFCERYRSFRKQNDVYMRRIYKAGERVMVDWAGLTMSYSDLNGNSHEVYIFVADLPASSYLYVEPFRDVKMGSWIDGHVHAFEYYGGVTPIIVPDNCKTAVTTPGLYDPKLNKTYHEMASFYGSAIIPARSRKPQDKAPVETGVQIAERRIIAKLRNQQYLSFEELREAVFSELEVVNTAPFQKLPSNRRDTFLEMEKKTLQSLPSGRFEYAEWSTMKVAFDYHVQYKEHYYSVPYTYAGKQIEIRSTASSIEIFFEHERIAVHPRSYDKTLRYITNPDHMPEKHRAVADWSKERFESWAEKIGPETASFIRYVMEQRDHPEQAFRTCAGILRLGDTLLPAKMEEVCHEAEKRHVYSFKYFSILMKQLTDKDPQTESKVERKQNVRGRSYYGGGNNAG